MTQMLTDRHHERLAGTLSCPDRIVITGRLPGACYAAGMTRFLNARHIRIFDSPRFAEPLRDRIREAAQALATAQGARIEHVAKAHIRKEDRVAAVRKDRGDHPGWMHVLSAMEAGDACAPWHDKQSHPTFLRHTSGQCLHYSFYWKDETLGLISLRVPTWSPFRRQCHCNGHSGLAHSLTTAGIDYAMADNLCWHPPCRPRSLLAPVLAGQHHALSVAPAPVCSHREGRSWLSLLPYPLRPLDHRRRLSNHGTKHRSGTRPRYPVTESAQKM